MSDVKIKIEFTRHYKLSVHISNMDILEGLKKYFETVDLIIFRTKVKKGLRRELSVNKLWEPATENSVLIDAGLIDYLVVYIQTINKEEHNIDLSVDIPQVNSIKLNEKWEKILFPTQKQDVETLTKFYGGIAAQHTGYGKTLCMLSIVDCLPGRSLILVPNSGILSEVQSRGEQFGVHIPHYAWNSSSCDILNPVGFLRAKESKKEMAIEWLSEVENVFTDEAHYLQARSWSDLFNTFLPNVVRAYGFSASPDSKEGRHLSPNGMTIRKLGFKSAKTIGLSGTTRVKRKSKIPVTLVEATAEITPDPKLTNSEDYVSWQDALSDMMKRPQCADAICTIMEKFPTVKFCIPIHAIEPGMILYERIVKCGINGIFWKAGDTIPKNETKEEDLTHVKQCIATDEYRFLMATSVGFEGIDIPILSGIIPLVGKSFRMVMQPAGRSARGEELIYVLLNDKHNRTMKNQTADRRKTIKNEYNVVRTHRLSL